MAAPVEIVLEKCIDVSFGDTSQNRTLIFVITKQETITSVDIRLPPDVQTTLYIVLGPDNEEASKQDGLAPIQKNPNYRRFVSRNLVRVVNKPDNITMRLVNGSDIMVALEELGRRCPAGDNMDVENVRSDTPVKLHWLQRAASSNEALTELHTQLAIPFAQFRVTGGPKVAIPKPSATYFRRANEITTRVHESKIATEGDFVGWLTSVPRRFEDLTIAENHVILLNGLAPSAFTRIILIVPKPNMYFITHEHFPNKLHLILVDDMARVRDVLAAFSTVARTGSTSVQPSARITIDVALDRNTNLWVVPHHSVATIRSRGQDFWRNVTRQPHLNPLYKYWQQTFVHDFYEWDTADPHFEKQLSCWDINKKTWTPTPAHTFEVIPSSVSEGVRMASESFFASERRGDNTCYDDLNFSRDLFNFSMWLFFIDHRDLATTNVEKNQTMMIDFEHFQQDRLAGEEWSTRTLQNGVKLNDAHESRVQGQIDANDVPFPAFPSNMVDGRSRFMSNRDASRAVLVRQERHMLVYVIISDNLSANAWYGARNIPANVKVYLVCLQATVRRMILDHNEPGLNHGKVFYQDRVVRYLRQDAAPPGISPETPLPARYVGFGFVQLKNSIKAYDHYLIFVKNYSRITKTLVDVGTAGLTSNRTPLLFVVVQMSKKAWSDEITIFVDNEVRDELKLKIFVTHQRSFLHWVRLSATPLFDAVKEFPLTNYRKAFKAANETLIINTYWRTGHVPFAPLFTLQTRDRPWAIEQQPVMQQAALNGLSVDLPYNYSQFGSANESVVLPLLRSVTFRGGSPSASTNWPRLRRNFFSSDRNGDGTKLRQAYFLFARDFLGMETPEFDRADNREKATEDEMRELFQRLQDAGHPRNEVVCGMLAIAEELHSKKMLIDNNADDVEGQRNLFERRFTPPGREVTRLINLVIATTAAQLGDQGQAVAAAASQGDQMTLQEYNRLVRDFENIQWQPLPAGVQVTHANGFEFQVRRELYRIGAPYQQPEQHAEVTLAKEIFTTGSIDGEPGMRWFPEDIPREIETWRGFPDAQARLRQEFGLGGGAPNDPPNNPPPPPPHRRDRGGRRDFRGGRGNYNPNKRRGSFPPRGGSKRNRGRNY